MDTFNMLARKIAEEDDLRRELDESLEEWYDDECFDDWDIDIDINNFDNICERELRYDNFYCNFDEAEFSAGDD